MSNENTNTRIGAWKKQTSKGEVITFAIDGQRYSMWPNTFKKGPTHPDFNIVPDRPMESRSDNSPIASAPPPKIEAIDDLPF